MTDDDIDITPQDRTLYEAWRSFRGIFVRAGASPLLLEMIRNAFYGGSAATLAIVCDAVKRDEAGDIDALVDEVHAFKFDICNANDPRREM